MKKEDKEKIGDVYTDSITLIVGDTKRFVSHSLIMCAVIVVASASTVVMGRLGKQIYPMVASRDYPLYNVDLADLWFRDDSAASTVYIIGTTMR